MADDFAPVALYSPQGTMEMVSTPRVYQTLMDGGWSLTPPEGAVSLPAWLYKLGEGGTPVGEMVENQHAYELLVSQGWQDSPARFGVETHPTSVPQRVGMNVLAAGDAEQAALVTRHGEMLNQLQVVVLQLQSTLQRHGEELLSLRADLTDFDSDLRDLEEGQHAGTPPTAQAAPKASPTPEGKK